MKVWILFSIANKYDQPDKAFEQLFWSKPTKEDAGFSSNEYWSKIIRGIKTRVDECTYWIEEFKKEDK